MPGEMFVDEQIQFDIRSLSDRLFSNIRWAGYIEFPHSSIYEFDVTGVEGHFKLWVGDGMIVDTENESAYGSFRAIENVLYDIKIEYSLVRCILSQHFSIISNTDYLNSIFVCVAHSSFLIGYQPSVVTAILVIKEDEKASSPQQQFVQLHRANPRISFSPYSY